MGRATWYHYHLPAIQPEPSTWGLRVLGLSVWSCFIWAAASAWQDKDAVDVCIPEGEEQAAQNHGFNCQERPLKDQGSSGIPSPVDGV